MDLNLNRADLMQVGTTSRRTLSLLVVPKKKQSKVVVGDHSSIVTCFGMKKSEITMEFRTMPLAHDVKEIGSLTFGGADANSKDKIFVSNGATIRGITKKGKDFFRFDTTLSERINNMFIEGSTIWSTGEYIYSQFVDCKEGDFLICPEKIYHFVCDNVSSTSTYNVITAAHDKNIRVLQGSDILYEAPVPGPASAVDIFGASRKKDSNDREYAYGTSGGVFGTMFLGKRSGRPGWSTSNDKKLGGVSCLYSYDINRDGNKELFVGREDGHIEVFSTANGEATSIFTRCIDESVTSLEAGYVGGSNEEIVISSYSGKIISFNSEISLKIEPKKISPDVKLQKLTALRQEIEHLQQQAEELKQKTTETRIVQPTTTTPAQIPQFGINEKFELIQEDASYMLSVEIQTPIDIIGVQSDVPVELLDTDTNVAILSRTKPDSDSGIYLLGTYRCQSATNRLNMKIRTMEGRYGTLMTYIIPRSTPKCCQVVSHPIKPLSLHQRIASIDEESIGRPLNELRITGSFGLAEAHAWVIFCLPDVPEKVTTEDVFYCFQSTFLGTYLFCRYKKGYLVLRSDSISTISILKEAIAKEATMRKTTISVNVDIKDESIPHFLTLVHPKFEYQVSS
eukprot:TRINITY_DN3026_c0_g1_i1.p1 TRINITY_DN3026_c0_g1~~TRINITY_DN3026_c0_g1_i1.p1  ORF type:complete len:624 (-),score=133.29 TRINITY_DN3026_c0_g1_i1:700-2571(-)